MGPGRTFFDPDLAYKPSAPDEVPAPVVKIVPAMPASQSERPQLRPVMSQED